MNFDSVPYEACPKCKGATEQSREESLVVVRCISCGNRQYPNSPARESNRSLPRQRLPASSSQPKTLQRRPQHKSGKADQTDSVRLLIDWLNWEFLRRSEPYRQEWERLEAKYKAMPKDRKKQDKWRRKRMDRNEFAYRAQEEAFVARKFNMDELYQPTKQFTRTEPPQFGRRLAVAPATPSLLDLSRDAKRPHSPILKDGYAAVVVDLRATNRELAYGIVDIVRTLRAPLPPANDVFGGAHIMASLKADAALPQEHPQRLSTKLPRMETYLKVWDLNRKLTNRKLNRSQRLQLIAKELIPNSDGDEDTTDRAFKLIEDHLSKANTYIRNAAAGTFPF